jgi:hypothetical protein
MPEVFRSDYGTVVVDFDLRRAELMTGIPAARLLAKIGLDIFSNIVKGTPVDTGLARSSWSITVNSAPPEGSASKLSGKMSKSAATNSALRNASRVKQVKHPTDVITIYNNVDYVYYLEFGTPKMQPFGMVRKSLAKAKAFFQSARSFTGEG